LLVIGVEDRGPVLPAPIGSLSIELRGIVQPRKYFDRPETRCDRSG
jgi:hypothetical protein